MGIVGECWTFTDVGWRPKGEAPRGALWRIWSWRRWNSVIAASSSGFGDRGEGSTVCQT
jgi:hypothetical protein